MEEKLAAKELEKEKKKKKKKEWKERMVFMIITEVHASLNTVLKTNNENK